MKYIILLGLICSFSIYTAEPKFRVEEIDAKVGVGYGLQLADMNGDAMVNILDVIALINTILDQ